MRECFESISQRNYVIFFFAKNFSINFFKIPKASKYSIFM